MKDYYKILGVDKNATPEEIKKAYRRAASKYHPDHAGGDAAKFREAKEAYDAITNPQPMHGSANSQQFEDVMSQMFRHFGQGFSGDFGQSFGGGKVQRNASINVPIKSAFIGAKLNITLFNNSPITIDIPAGVQEGQLVYSTEKDNVTIAIFANIVNSDEYSINDRSSFIRTHDATIYSRVHVSPFKLITGGFVKYKCIDDEEIMVRIPAAVSLSSLLKVKGRGYWLDSSCKARGDCLLTIVPIIKKISEYDKQEIDDFIKEYDKARST